MTTPLISGTITIATASIGAAPANERVLVSTATQRNLVIVLDAGALTSYSSAASTWTPDTIEVRLYAGIQSAAATALAYMATYVNIQVEPIKYSIPLPNAYTMAATITQTTGSANASGFAWTLIAL